MSKKLEITNLPRGTRAIPVEHMGLEGAARMVHAACIDPERRAGDGTDILPFARVAGRVVFSHPNNHADELMKQLGTFFLVQLSDEAEIAEYLDAVLNQAGDVYAILVHQGAVAHVRLPDFISLAEASA